MFIAPFYFTTDAMQLPPLVYQAYTNEAALAADKVKAQEFLNYYNSAMQTHGHTAKVSQMVKTQSGGCKTCGGNKTAATSTTPKTGTLKAKALELIEMWS